MRHQRLLLILLISLLVLTGITVTNWWRQRQIAAQALLEARLSFFRTDWTPVEMITDQLTLRSLGAAFRQAAKVPATPPNQELPLYRLQLDFAGQCSHYLLTHDLRIFNHTLDGEVMLDSAAREALARHVDRLRQQQFGELLAWSEVSQLIPRYSTFSVTDLETGLTFKTQRRAGSRHADIQPLTKADTAVMKIIYAGAWSWNRRAAVVEYAGRRIAASMNGMPHGAGALVNGFPGHHCLHFFGSTTHATGNVDPVHQLMVQRAAGNLCEYLDQLPPEDLQILALEMAGQGDVAAISLLTHHSDTNQSALAGQIRDLRIWSKQVNPPVDGTQHGNYSISVLFHGDTREYRINVTVISRYFGYLGKWLVEPDYLQQLINAKG